MTNRETDINGYITIKRNPISKVGVFPYLGKNIDPALEPNQIYFVYRPAEELCKPETINSFKHIPIIEDHTMLGTGQTPAERKGVDGVTGEDVGLEGDILYADLHIYSETLKRRIDGGDKKDLSIGYRVGKWEKANGLFNGQPYDYIQRGLLGNHVAVVKEGRAGKEVSVLDHTITYAHMDIVQDGTFKEEHIKKLEATIAHLKTKNDDDSRKELKRTEESLARAKKNTASDSTASPAADNDGDAEQNKTKGANDMADPEKKDEDKKTSMDDVKAFMKDFAKDRKAFDKLMDEMTPKEKEAEKKAEDADTTEKDGDQKLAKDEDDKEKKDEKKAEDKSAMDAAIAGLRTEVADLRKNGMKALMAEMAKRDEVIKEVAGQFGTFATDSLDTVNEVAAYGLKKAGITAPAGSEHAVWSAYNAGRKASGGQVRHALDTRDVKAPVGSLIAATLAASSK